MEGNPNPEAETLEEVEKTFKTYNEVIRKWLNDWNITSSYNNKIAAILNYNIRPYPYSYYENQPRNNFYDSGVYLLTIYDFIYNDTLIAFRYDDISHFRDMYGLACLNSDLDY